MKRELRVQQILRVAYEKKLNINTLIFLLAMTPDKGLIRVQKKIDEIEKLYRVEARLKPRGKVIASFCNVNETKVNEFKETYKNYIVKVIKL